MMRKHSLVYERFTPSIHQINKFSSTTKPYATSPNPRSGTSQAPKHRLLYDNNMGVTTVKPTLRHNGRLDGLHSGKRDCWKHGIVVKRNNGRNRYTVHDTVISDIKNTFDNQKPPMMSGATEPLFLSVARLSFGMPKNAVKPTLAPENLAPL